MSVDSHCHLDFPGLSNQAACCNRIRQGGGRRAHGDDFNFLARHETYRALAEAHDTLFFTIGTHPHNAASEPDVPEERLVELAQHPRCIAIGEAGLDYHYDKSPRDVQKKVFRTHIAAARSAGLPLIIHARNADDDSIEILRDETAKGRFDAVLHCFSSTAELAEVGVELGLYVSFSRDPDL